ncbi:MAG: hypothetical protein ACR2KT_12225 [Methylocella sp.]|nr:MAG: hypothetical protein DLM68_02235 [Hyphomicrobiales bacterium]
MPTTLPLPEPPLAADLKPTPVTEIAEIAHRFQSDRAFGLERRISPGRRGLSQRFVRAGVIDAIGAIADTGYSASLAGSPASNIGVRFSPVSPMRATMTRDRFARTSLKRPALDFKEALYASRFMDRHRRHRRAPE